MKLATVRDSSGAISAAAGVLHQGQIRLLRLDPALRAWAAHTGASLTIEALASQGQQGIAMAVAACERALREGEAAWLMDPQAVRWELPMRLGTGWCAGRNFGKHLRESQAASNGAFHFDHPTGFIKLPHTLVPHQTTVRCPVGVRELDYEVEVAAVIGQAGADISVKNALNHVFGYTVFNDLSARDWQRSEMRNGLLCLGKNFRGFGPIGPWIVTSDEIPNPSQLRLRLSVNGEPRQDDWCTDMIFDFAALIAHWSRSGLESGDFIGSGTPSGVALHSKPDPSSFFLRPGDRVRARVDVIGCLDTLIA